MSSNRDFKLGVFIVAAGLVILLGKWGVFGFLGRHFWPLLLLVPGILLHIWFFGRGGSPLVLVPAGILTVYGVLFEICAVWGWDLMPHLWPLLLLGVALGLYEYALQIPRPRGLAAGAAVAGGISILLLFIGMLGAAVLYLIGILLIVGGIWLIAGRRRKRFFF
ncbi:hypothetical protein F4V43_03830 [Paenibacillus spiritus]|uniref:DUF5668 domain-containing protein n=1 Tax=Paenibacillus spiritus TaxID=2496557 RepID=A0A5J5GHK1_9BACL|nr:hypothetical protein [Paenibacillus spiritus]KAA9007625.1 hypothetical protein F4V43_03830 [Paenibacillus spiritus]